MTKNIITTIGFQKGDEGFSPTAFIELFENAYLDLRREDSFKQKKSFAPSTLGYGNGTCPRYWYIAFNGEEFKETADAHSIANMINGTDAHARIEKVLKNTGVVDDVEVEINWNNPPIRGFVDFILKWGPRKIVGEIKTTKQEAWEFRQNKNKPTGYHLLQLLIYMYVLGLDEGIILYENKNTHDILLITIRMTDENREIVLDAYDWMRRVYAAYEEELLPERPFRKNTRICKSCPVYDSCYSSKYGVGDVRIPPLEVPKP